MDSMARWGCPVTDLVGRTGAAIGAALRRRDSRIVLVTATLGYLVVYLFATGDLALTGGRRFSFFLVEEPLQRMFRPVGFGRFEPIARLSGGGVTLLVSPINDLVATFLAVLVGLNLALTYLGLVQPKACGLEASSSVFAGIPALLSGAACCGPLVLIIFGLQASSILITGFQLLVPIAAVLLVGSLLLIGRQVDPALL